MINWDDNAICKVLRSYIPQSTAHYDCSADCNACCLSSAEHCLPNSKKKAVSLASGGIDFEERFV